MSARYIMTNASAQTATDYMAAVDANAEVCFRTAAAFSPSQADIPGMTVRVEAGALLSGSTLTEVAAQNTAVLSAPVESPRIDRVVISRATGAVSVITGVEAASPSAPALTADVLPVAQVALAVGQTSITNADITDERICGGSGDMLRANNLSDLMDVATARANLGLGTAALLDAGTTPPQFDNDTSLATTEFVQRALGNVRGYLPVLADTTLTAADAGKDIICATASSITVTLPSGAELPAGARYHIINNGGAGSVTVQRAGADTIRIGGSAITQFTLLPGDNIIIDSIGSTVWYAMGGSAQLKYSGAFEASLAASGYQKLPGGLIIQWGWFNASPTPNTDKAVNFPITFPTALSALTLSVQDNALTLSSAWYSTKSASGFNGRSNVGSAGIAWIAIGH